MSRHLFNAREWFLLFVLGGLIAYVVLVVQPWVAA